MLAADTNVIVRLVLIDDLTQHRRCLKLFASNRVWIAKTVLLEAHWVLRSRYKYSSLAAARAIRIAAGFENVVFGRRFADALHLASRGPRVSSSTFDAKLVRRAARVGFQGVVPA